MRQTISYTGLDIHTLSFIRTQLERMVDEKGAAGLIEPFYDTPEVNTLLEVIALVQRYMDAEDQAMDEEYRRQNGDQELGSTQ